MVHNDSSWGGYASCSSASRWSRAQNKLFELAIVFFPEGSPDRWTKIAHHVPGKTPMEVEAHYNDLVSDIERIESGEIELPTYLDDDGVYECRMNPINKDEPEADMRQKRTERRKGVPWTEEEHKKFLVGLEKYGKGDWRSISRYVVLTRTPSQVASHAQKYFIRLRTQSSTNLILRPSIHDVTISKVDSITTLGSASAATSAAAAAYSVPSSDSISVNAYCWNVNQSSGNCGNMLSYGGEQRWTSLLN